MIDGSSLIFRAFYALPESIRAAGGQPVNAAHGFFDMLAKLVTDHRPVGVAVATDEDWRPAWRVELVPAYKAQRVDVAIPESLTAQMELIYTLLPEFGVTVGRVPDHEAEDVVASLAARITAGGGSVLIASGDRDLFCLVRDPAVAVLYPEARGAWGLIDEAAITRRYGIPGHRYADFAVLRGDPSDGLPGVPRVGEKTAARLVAQYPDLESMIAAGCFTPPAADYVRRARKVVNQVSTLPVAHPGRLRPPTPEAAGRLSARAAELGLSGPVARLLRAIDNLGS